MDPVTPKPTRGNLADLTARGVVGYKTGSATANETYAWPAGIKHLMVTTDDTYTLTITLPPVAEMAGQILSVYLDADGGQDCTLTDAGDDADFTDSTIDDADDCTVVFSTGVRWIKLVNAAAQ